MSRHPMVPVPGRTDVTYRPIFHHTAYGIDGSAAATLALLQMDGGNMSIETTAVNPCMPSACRMRRVALHTATGGVNVAGDWTLSIRKNASGADDATFLFNPTTLSDKFSGVPSTVLTFEAGDTWWAFVSGPSRNVLIVRVTFEFELL